MADGVWRLHVGEVSDRLERGLELSVGETDPERGLGSDDSVPAARLIEVSAQRWRFGDEQVHDLRVELRAATLPGDGNRGVRPASPVEHLDYVGERDQPGGDQNLLTPRALRHPPAIPALEGLLDAVPDRLRQA